jgi:hypothetical protein
MKFAAPAEILLRSGAHAGRSPGKKSGKFLLQFAFYSLKCKLWPSHVDNGKSWISSETL